jgi:hypothetical protein
MARSRSACAPADAAIAEDQFTHHGCKPRGLSESALEVTCTISALAGGVKAKRPGQIHIQLDFRDLQVQTVIIMRALNA